MNVFGYENKVYPLYISKKKIIIKHLIYYQSLKKKLHYVFIKDFNRLMFSRTRHKGKKHYCMSCLQNFTTEEI